MPKSSAKIVFFAVGLAKNRGLGYNNTMTIKIGGNAYEQTV